MKKIRVLFIHGGSLTRGGTEAFMMNTLREISEDIHIDFIVHGDLVGVYDEEVLNHGCKIYHVPIKSKHLIRNMRMMRKILRAGNYDIVHAHLNAMNGPALKIAKQCGVKTRISHSHASEHYTEHPIKLFLNNHAKNMIPRYATAFFACSKKAGDFLYGDIPYKICYNAIDINRYVYDKAKRFELRSQYHLDDKHVFGHVGRFNFQKNHTQLIEIFSRIYQSDPKAHLVLVGTGELEANIKAMVSEKKLDEAVTFMGGISNVNEMLNAFDVFLLPSIFEGLPYALVEAQANGLPVLCSDNTDLETKILDHFEFVNPDNVDEWVSKALEYAHTPRAFDFDAFRDRGFEIKDATRKLENFYRTAVFGEHQ